MQSYDLADIFKSGDRCLLYHAEHVVVRDLIFQKSGFWNLQITYSNDVLVEK